MGNFSKSLAIQVLGTVFCLLGAGCAPGERSGSGAVLSGDQTERAELLNSVQVSSTKRAPHERGIIGLLRLNAAGESIGTCGAVLIRPDVILSASHCFDPTMNIQLVKVYPISSM